MNDSAGGSPEHALTEVLRSHPAVADAAVVTGEDGRCPSARIVPDPDAAPVLHRSAALEAAGRLGGLAWHEPAAGVRVAGVNRGETDFLYREIFTENAYFRHGITLPRGAVVVDVGANIGMFTLAAALHGPGARIIAVEPVAELADAVALNAELHGVDATVLRVALGRADGETAFTFYPGNSVMSGRFADAAEDFDVLRGYLRTGRDAERGAQLDRLVADRMRAEPRRVPVTTLAGVADGLGLRRIDLLKIDVEKAEAEVLEGIGDALWPRIDRIVMEVHDIGGRLDAVLGQLRSRGFEVAHDQDPRLLLTPCHNVYARRPEAEAGPSPEAPPAFHGGPVERDLEAELRELIARRLPSAVPPDRFTVAADLAAADGPTAAPAAVPDPAGGPRAAALARIWAGLFGAEAVRQDADFFDLGGDSLTAVRMLAEIEAELGEGALTPDLIFTESTFGALAAAVEAGPLPGGPADR
ncbi:FkbM family methyltransferase [Streptomyces xinghaiensis]|uniref:FkbM family methyltransferase n=1 Tax=Streptomyces xinghaiensis TaxID=1038928 RepID=UPI002E117EE0|nr:FkbM family methyltransferase [Streptomyces xinghaiensis]